MGRHFGVGINRNERRVLGLSLLCESWKLVLGKALEREFSSAHRRGSVELGTSANGVGHDGGLGWPRDRLSLS